MQAALDIYFDSIRSQRPEFETAIPIWRDRLSPALEVMEAERREVIGRAYKRTAIIGAIVLAVLIGLT